MARIAPVTKNGSTSTPTSESSFNIQVDKRLENLEKQMERALQMLEVITINTNNGPKSPVEAFQQQIMAPALQQRRKSVIARADSLHAMQLKSQHSQESKSDSSSNNSFNHATPDQPTQQHSQTQAIFHAAARDLTNSTESHGESDDHFISHHHGEVNRSSIDSVSSHHNHVHHFGDNGTPKHSFVIPSSETSATKPKKEVEGGNTKDGGEKSDGTKKPQHRGSTLVVLSSMMKDTTKNIKRAQLKLKRDLRVGIEKLSGEGNNRERIVNGHHHPHEPKHPVLAHHPTMINPRNKFRLCWDMLLLMPLLLYLTFVMPFRICFANDPAFGSPGYWFEFSIEVVFIADIFLNFRTGYFIGGLNDDALGNNIEYHPLSVARHYLRTWFFLDLVSGIPFSGLDLILTLNGGKNSDSADVPLLKLVKSLRLLRFLKLIRLLKIEEMTSHLVMDRDTVDRIEDFFQEGSTRSGVILLSLALQLGFICHIAACIWTYIGRRGAINGDHTWLYYEESGPFTEKDTTGGDNVSSIYLAAFYYSLTTMTSVGYGDIIPRSDSERTYAICLEFIGGFVFAMIIASLTSVVTSSDMNQRKVSEQLDSVSSFVQNRQFPSALGRRIRRHFRQFYSHKSAIDERKIFGEMSSSLRRDVSSYIVSVRMSDVKLFQSMNPKLWPRLFPLLNPTHFEMGEHVCTQGEECSEMFIILDGSLSGQTLIDTQMINQGGQLAASSYSDNNSSNSSLNGGGSASSQSAINNADMLLESSRGRQLHMKSQYSLEEDARNGIKEFLAAQNKAKVVETNKLDSDKDTSSMNEILEMSMNSDGEERGDLIGELNVGDKTDLKTLPDNNSSSSSVGIIHKTFSSLLEGSSKPITSVGGSFKKENTSWFSGSLREMSLKKDLSVAANAANAAATKVPAAGKGHRGSLTKNRRDTFSAATFVNGSWRNKSSSEKVKMRHIGVGDSVNVLCVVQIWNRCVETVIAETNVETYCVNADEFNTLFNHDNLVDVETFNQMRIQEVANFRMDLTQPAPTIFGVPLYMTFSCVSCTVVAARGIMAADSNLIGANTSDPYATIELVDYETGRSVNSQWFMRTPTRRKTLSPVWTEKHTSRWRDIHLPFESLGLRITLYDEDVMEDDDKLGEVYLRVSDLDLEDEDCPFFRVPDKRLLHLKSEKAREVIKNSDAAFALSSESSPSHSFQEFQTSQANQGNGVTEYSDFDPNIEEALGNGGVSLGNIGNGGRFNYLSEEADGSDSDIEFANLGSAQNHLNAQSSRSFRNFAATAASSGSSSPELKEENEDGNDQRAKAVIDSLFSPGGRSDTSSKSNASATSRKSGSRRSFGKFSNDSVRSSMMSREGNTQLLPPHSEHWDKIRVASKFTSPIKPSNAWGGILAALTKKVGVFNPDSMDEEISEEDEMILEQLDAQNRGMIDMWHELLPTQEMIKASERSGKPLPASLGAIRLRTWIKRGERTNHEDGGDEEPDIEMNYSSHKTTTEHEKKEKKKKII